MNKKYLLTNTSFSQLNDEEMPREKALARGIRSLSDEELMALIFGTGLKGMSVIEMSRMILNDNEGHISRIAGMDTKEFVKRYKGIGPAKALLVLGALELGRRAAKDAAEMSEQRILSSQVAYDIMRYDLESLDHEEFWVLLMNNSAVVIAKEFIAAGGQTATAVDVRIIMRKALERKATRMIIFHNHPSGNNKPSIQDDALTRKIKEAAALFDIRLDDHIIITPHSYFSYTDNSRL